MDSKTAIVLYKQLNIRANRKSTSHETQTLKRRVCNRNLMSDSKQPRVWLISYLYFDSVTNREHISSNNTSLY